MSDVAVSSPLSPERVLEVWESTQQHWVEFGRFEPQRFLSGAEDLWVQQAWDELAGDLPAFWRDRGPEVRYQRVWLRVLDFVANKSRQNRLLRAFHRDPEIKRHYVERVRYHARHDHLVRRVGWIPAQSRGCAIGCTLEAYRHERYPAELGIPEWLAYLEDVLFERMSVENSREWPERFLMACPVGACLESVRSPFLLWLVREVVRGLEALPATECLPAVVRLAHHAVELLEDETSDLEILTGASHQAFRLAEQLLVYQLPGVITSTPHTALSSFSPVQQVAWAAWYGARAVGYGFQFRYFSTGRFAPDVTSAVVWCLWWVAARVGGLTDLEVMQVDQAGHDRVAEQLLQLLERAPVG